MYDRKEGRGEEMGAQCICVFARTCVYARAGVGVGVESGAYVLHLPKNSRKRWAASMSSALVEFA